MDFTFKTCRFVENPCYRKRVMMEGNAPKGIVVHSTGCEMPYLRRLVQPVEWQTEYSEVIKDLGKHKYNNHWNRKFAEDEKHACVHFHIGLNNNDEICTYKVLPENVCCWGCGNGMKGSYNNNPNAYIQFEIHEDDLTSEDYFNKAFNEAIELCGWLCFKYGLPIETVVGHCEAHDLGYASNHSDPEHWLKKFGKDMNWFRKQVQIVADRHNAEAEEIINGETEPDKTEDTIYRVQVGAYKIRKNAEKKLEAIKKAGFDDAFITED